MSEAKPNHMTARQFDTFILECAKRDREMFLASLAPRFATEPDAEAVRLIAETKAEIRAMTQRMARLRRVVSEEKP